MTLEELQERYPHGSRWKLLVADVRTLATTNQGRRTAEYTVVGWREGTVILVDHNDNTAQISARNMPQPQPPCPITEPVTLRMYPGPYWCEAGRPGGADLGHIPPITLHPPGTTGIIGSGREYGTYTWGET